MGGEDNIEDGIFLKVGRSWISHVLRGVVKLGQLLISSYIYAN